MAKGEVCNVLITSNDAKVCTRAAIVGHTARTSRAAIVWQAADDDVEKLMVIEDESLQGIDVQSFIDDNCDGETIIEKQQSNLEIDFEVAIMNKNNCIQSNVVPICENFSAITKVFL